MEFITQFFGKVINFIYGFTGDYGVAIVIFTLLFRLCMVPVNMRQRKKKTGNCLLPFLQLPVMYGIYNAIRLVCLAGATTVLMPWVASILLRDRFLILPMATVFVQILPQVYPYLRFFKDLELQKAPMSMILILLFSNSLFVFMIPSGVGLYYFVSGLFSALEQFVVHYVDRRKRKIGLAS